MDRSPSFMDDSNIPRAALDRSVVNCNLFGEEGDLPDVVHCETIEARSKLHDWELRRHRHGRLHQVLLIERGGGEAALEDRMLPLGSMRGVNVPIGCIHGFTFVPGTQGWVVTLASETLDRTLEPTDPVRRVLSRPAAFDGDTATCALMQRIFDEYDGRGFARAQCLRSLSGLLLGLVARSLRTGAPASAAPDAAADTDSRFARFEELVEAHHAERWSVADYAKALSITPVHLTRIAREATGMPASRVIEERIVREARRNLVYTDLPVSVVAYALGFEDPAYFSRMFARSTGMSPRRFRDLAHGRGGVAAESPLGLA